jgi:hypothetical protein
MWYSKGCAEQVQMFFVQRLHVVGVIGLIVAFIQVIIYIFQKYLNYFYNLIICVVVWADFINAVVLHGPASPQLVQSVRTDLIRALTGGKRRPLTDVTNRINTLLPVSKCMLGLGLLSTEVMFWQQGTLLSLYLRGAHQKRHVISNCM